MKNNIKKIIAGVLVTGSIIGGVAIFNNAQKDFMTYQEYKVLLSIYQYEIDESGGEIVIKDVNGKMDIVDKLNEIILKREETKRVNLDGNDLSSVDYEILKRGLIEKSIKSKK